MNPRFEKRVTTVVIHRLRVFSFAFHVSDSGFALSIFMHGPFICLATNGDATYRNRTYCYIYIYFGLALFDFWFTGYSC